MKSNAFKIDWRILAEYLDTIAVYGPDSKQSIAVREKHNNVVGFIEIADKFDQLKRKVGGSGIDYPPQEK